MSALLRVTPSFGGRRALRMYERNVVVYRRQWPLLMSGFAEPFFYLLSIGLGLSHLVGSLRLGSQLVVYTSFAAPGLLASSAMNGAMFDATFNLFWKLKIEKTYEGILCTPMAVADVALGELLWCLTRAGIYSAAFLVVMAGLGYVITPWAVLCYPAAMLISFAFASVGMAATSYMRTWQDFDLVALALIPLFLFSGTFYPLTVYPAWLQLVVRCTPLYQGVALVRGLDAGLFTASMAGHVLYLLAMGGAGLVVTGRRFATLLLP